MRDIETAPTYWFTLQISSTLGLARPNPGAELNPGLPQSDRDQTAGAHPAATQAQH